MSKFKLYARDPISSYTHFIGGILAVIATVFLILKGGICAGVFGLSMVLLYFASSIYHFYKDSPEKIKRLRKLDHSMIYVLIAGTYTPLLIHLFPRPISFYLCSTMWIMAIFGTLIKVFWINAPRWLSVVSYVLMGWVIMIDPSCLIQIEFWGIFWLVLGGVLYTIGAVIYALKKPNISAEFGFHEIFHIFVMLGTFSQFICIYFFVI